MTDPRDAKKMSDAQIEERIVRLAFDGDALRYREFCAKLKSGLLKALV